MSLLADLADKNKPTKNQQRMQITKLLILGPASAGKSVFGKQLEKIYNGTAMPIDRITTSLYRPTPGIDFHTVHTPRNHVYVLWELAGQTHYTTLWPLWWNGAKGALIIMDSTQIDDNYLDRIKDILSMLQNAFSLPYIICLNKQDLKKVDPIVLETVSISLGVPKDRIIPTCATTGSNVKEAFDRLLKL